LNTNFKGKEKFKRYSWFKLTTFQSVSEDIEDCILKLDSKYDTSTSNTEVGRIYLKKQFHTLRLI